MQFHTTISELLAVKDLAFGWYPKRIKLNKSGQLKNWIKDGMSHPPIIKIQWSTCNGQKNPSMSPLTKGPFDLFVYWPTP